MEKRSALKLATYFTKHIHEKKEEVKLFLKAAISFS